MRDLRARYRNAFLGIGWALITPLALTVTFTFVLAKVGRVPTDGVPYPLYAYIGLISWFFFTASVTGGSNSLLNNITILRRTYMPREVFPISVLLVSLTDYGLSALMLVLLFPILHFGPRLTLQWVPLYFAIQLLFTSGLAIVLSAAVVYVRDLRHLVAIALQVGLFATPVAYGLSAIPDRWRHLYVFFNPLGTVIDGYRRSLFLGEGPDWSLVIASGASALLVAVAGYWLFKAMEGGVADIS